MSPLAALLLSFVVQQPPAFAAEVESVHLDVFVSVKGTPVLGLSAADFEVRDNGVVQAAELVEVERVPIRVVLVLDTSASVAGGKLDQLRGAARALLQDLRRGDEAALLAFSHELRLQVPPTLDREAVERALGGIEASGSTAGFDALYAAVTLPATATRPVVVLFTDGEDNASVLSAEDAREAVDESGALVHVVGIEPPADPRTVDARIVEGDLGVALRGIAEGSGGRLWRAASAERLREAFLRILDEMRTRYLLRYVPRGIPRAGRHRVEVRLKGRKAELRTRRGYVVTARPPL